MKRIYGLLVIVLMLAWSVVVFVNKDRVTAFANQNYICLFFGCFLANSMLFLPAPGLLLVVVAAMALNPIVVAILSGLGFAFGDCLGYIGGYYGKQTIAFDKELKIGRLFDKHGGLFIITTAALPLPIFDCVAVYCGMIRYPFKQFFAFCLVGKMIKTFVYAMFAYDIYSYMHL